MEIINNRNQKFGIYCGEQTGRKVIVTGEYVLVIFRTDFFSGERGFLLVFDVVPIGRLFFKVCSFCMLHTICTLYNRVHDSVNQPRSPVLSSKCAQVLFKFLT